MMKSPVFSIIKIIIISTIIINTDNNDICNIVILLILMTECYSAGLKLWIKVDVYDFE